MYIPNCRFDADNFHMTEYIGSDDFVLHMEMDRFVPGNLLYSTFRSLKTTDGITTQTIVGNHSDRSAYIEGVGEDARFSQLNSFHQLAGPSVVVVDTKHNCLRHVDRFTMATSSYSGKCNMKPGSKEGMFPKFNAPYFVVRDVLKPTKLLISDTGNQALRHLDITNKFTTLVTRKTSDPIFAPRGLTQDSDTGDIYITAIHAIYHFNYKLKIVSLLAGSAKKGFADGGFLVARFYGPKRSLLFDNRSKLLVADESNDRLRVLNLTLGSRHQYVQVFVRLLMVVWTAVSLTDLDLCW